MKPSNIGFWVGSGMFIFLNLILLPTSVFAQRKQSFSPLQLKGQSIVLNKDVLGNQLPDFSLCGYAASNKPITTPPVVIELKPEKGRDRINIQRAIDQLARLPLNSDGFRGTIKLLSGQFITDGSIRIHASGIVLAGSGMGKGGTLLLSTAIDRMPVVHVIGKPDIIGVHKFNIRHHLLSGSTTVETESATGLSPGDEVQLQIRYKSSWIDKMGTAHFGGGITATGWKPGERDLFIDRTITQRNGNTLFLDAGFPVFVDSSNAQIDLVAVSRSPRIRNVGVENLILQSAVDLRNPLDEDHAWDAIVMEQVEDAWVRRIAFSHFAGSAVRLLPTSRRVTVEDCTSTEPVSERGGQRRLTFYTEGQQTLFQRCFASEGYQDFGVGFATPGPNAFVQCYSKNPISFSGTIQSWSPGVLFDNVAIEGQAIRMGYRGQDGDGAGWTTGNSLIWQSTAALIQCDSTPSANNFAFGCWAQFSGNGFWEQSNEHIQPRSFFYAQWQTRMGKPHPAFSMMLPKDSEASSSPSVVVAAELSRLANQAPWELQPWIFELDTRYPLSYTRNLITKLPSIPDVAVLKQDTFSITNGWLTVNGKLSIGRRTEVPWWSGGVTPRDIAGAKPHITRFVPGRTGLGYTDLLPDVIDAMDRSQTVMLEHNYGLWYERRRDDHERIKRMDSDVWPPFYELPFARSGQHTAWDGLSKYDLTRYNKWYWKRLQDFATLASTNAKWLFHQHYFQHNILEAGAHFTDFPWRTANNINNTGMPEPVPYAGDKRIFVDHLFYDTTHPVRKPLHQGFIQQNVQAFADNPNVIHAISAEFTGSYAFARFWLKEVGKGQQRSKVKPLIAISMTKDVQDSLLRDPSLSKVASIIDIRYWHIQHNGLVYAPKGGEHLAPRQHARLLKPQRPSFESVISSIQPYRVTFRDKAVLYSADGNDQFGWAVLMAGGSLPVLPSSTDTAFLKAVVQTNPVAGEKRLEGKLERIVYLEKDEKLRPEWTINAKEYRILSLSSGTIMQTLTDIQQYQSIQPCVIWIKLH